MSTKLLGRLASHAKYAEALLYMNWSSDHSSVENIRMPIVYFSVSILSLCDRLTHIPRVRLEHLSAWIVKSLLETPMGTQIANIYAGCAALTILDANIPYELKNHVISLIRLLARPDGSFSAALDNPGEADVRFTYSAIAACYLLGINFETVMNTKLVIDYIRRCQSFDGGFSLTPGHEAHGGSTHCSIASLSLLLSFLNPSQLGEKCSNSTTLFEAICNDLKTPEGKRGSLFSSLIRSDVLKLQELINVPLLIRWLSMRIQPSNTPTCSADSTASPCAFIGFNGRPGKDCDSCYTFWISASLSILKQSFQINLSHSSKNCESTKLQEADGNFSDNRSVDSKDIPLKNLIGGIAVFLGKSKGNKGGFARDSEAFADPFHSHYALFGLSIAAILFPLENSFENEISDLLDNDWKDAIYSNLVIECSLALPIRYNPFEG